MEYVKEWFNHNFSVRSLVVLVLLGGSIYLAIVDEKYRNQFSHLASVGVGGYLGQLIPKRKE